MMYENVTCIRVDARDFLILSCIQPWQKNEFIFSLSRLRLASIHRCTYSLPPLLLLLLLVLSIASAIITFSFSF